jgi:hypothetical protein
MTLGVIALAVGLVSVGLLTRRCWDKRVRRTDSVIGSQLSPRRQASEDLP